jgi:hypothetical protein
MVFPIDINIILELSRRTIISMVTAWFFPFTAYSVTRYDLGES